MSDTAPGSADPASYVGRIRRGGRWLLVSLATLVVIAGIVSGSAYHQLGDNISSEQVEDQFGDRPAMLPSAPNPSPSRRAPRALNILVIGSDTRAGENTAYGAGIGGARGDLTLLVHLSADRKRAAAVSIPRDSMVRIPACRRRDGTTSPAGLDLFNAAFARGGSACAIRTVEQLTKIYIDHHVVVDFEGFKRMVDALGKVQICVPRDVDDEKSKLRLSAGRHEVDGETALAYVRNRTLDGSGDIGRIKRQQAFLAAVTEKASSAGVLANPKRLYGFLTAATKSLTTDPELASLNALRKLAQNVQGIGPDRIRFLTVPWRVYPPDPNRVQWTAQAQDLWRVLREDRPLPAKWAASRTSAARTAAKGVCR